MMYTFDNTFQVSFLFRDGLIAFDKDDEGLPVIFPIDPNEKRAKPAEMTSFTSSLSHDLIQVRIISINVECLATFLRQNFNDSYFFLHFIEVHQKIQDP